jgi:acyl-CoA synthetase (AMP-forming)/AMP-acid ligase II
MITHQNLFHNLTTIVRSLEADTSTQVVSWLPQYHDMGLIGSYLGVVFCGGSGVYMSPISFVKHPPMWIYVRAAQPQCMWAV